MKTILFALSFFVPMISQATSTVIVPSAVCILSAQEEGNLIVSYYSCDDGSSQSINKQKLFSQGGNWDLLTAKSIQFLTSRNISGVPGFLKLVSCERYGPHSARTGDGVGGSPQSCVLIREAVTKEVP